MVPGTPFGLGAALAAIAVMPATAVQPSGDQDDAPMLSASGAVGD